MPNTFFDYFKTLYHNVHHKDYWFNTYSYTEVWQKNSILEIIFILLLIGLLYLFRQYIKNKKTIKNKMVVNNYTLFSLIFLFLFSSFSIIIATQYLNYYPKWFYLVAIISPWFFLIQIILIFLRYLFPNQFTLKTQKFVTLLFVILFIGWVTNINGHLIKLSKTIHIPLGKSSISIFALLMGFIWSVMLICLTLRLEKVIESQIMKIKILDIHSKIIFSKIFKIIAIFISITIILPFFGINITALTVLGGAFVAGVGFSLKNIISNYISGFLILIEKSVRINDRITINGFTGYVTKITSRFVVIQSYYGVEAIIPNEKVTSDIVFNESLSFKELQKEFIITVSHESNIDQVIQIMLSAMKGTQNVSELKEPSVAVSKISTIGIEVTGYYWLIDPRRGIAEPHSHILQKIKKEFDLQGIKLAKTPYLINPN